MMPGSRWMRAALRWLPWTWAVALSRPHLHQLSLHLLCEARCFDSEEFHPGRQPSEPDVFLCWLIYCLSGTVGTLIWLPVNFLAGCLLRVLLTRIHACLKESNALLVQTDLSASTTKSKRIVGLITAAELFSLLLLLWSLDYGQIVFRNSAAAVRSDYSTKRFSI